MSAAKKEIDLFQPIKMWLKDKGYKVEGSGMRHSRRQRRFCKGLMWHIKNDKSLVVPYRGALTSDDWFRFRQEIKLK